MHSDNGSDAHDTGDRGGRAVATRLHDMGHRVTNMGHRVVVDVATLPDGGPSGVFFRDGRPGNW